MYYIKNIITGYFAFSLVFSATLQEIYDQAEPFNDYDKYIILDSETIYTGGLGIYEGDVFINCQGAIIDLEGGSGIWVYADEQYPSSLEMKYCTIIDGDYYGLSFGGSSNGNIINCNFINTNFGLKLFDESNVYISNSIFALNNTYGIAIYTEHPVLEASYSLFWENQEADCMENCPGWGNIWTQLELQPGIGVIYENPQFINESDWNFNLNSTSSCINNGNPDLFDTDGSISDIGAIPFNQNCFLSGDLNNDGIINVIDIVDLVNCVLFSESCSICFDVNEDNEYNILDILDIVNIIIN